MAFTSDILSYLDGVDYKQNVIIFSTAIYAFEQYLNYRQYRLYLLTDRPENLTDIVSESVFKKSQSYNLDKSRFGFVHNAFKQLETIAVLHYDVLPLLWDFAGQLMFKYAGYGHEHEIVQSLIFVVLYSLISTITSIPFSLYSNFVVEERHGFNKQTIGLFFTDLLKMQLVLAALALPFLSIFLWIIQKTGSNFYFYVWVIFIVFQLFFLTIFPTVIQPLFNKLVPLEEGDLRKRIEELAASIKFPLKKLYVIDGSKRSSHSNAYFYGFGKNKQIVLFDTLLEHSDTDEVCAVLAHELGHWYMSHTLKLIIVNQVYMLALFWMFSYFIHNAKLYTDFGFNTMPTMIGFMLFQLIYIPIDSVLNFLMHVYQRRKEYEADAFALKLGYASTLRNALIKLSAKNLGGFNNDSWHSAWNHSHPSLVERLSALGVKPTSDKPIVEETEAKKEQ
ncbi:hypothetical protein EC973_000679 [Apophysomyces ossiformis]|uniref:CAAX prenyl protease n=1 Tax=Apophysomyces ossiformis TaxID=679940 RepID=A0A8H7BUI1_9FUNG|nr:hypothetical protein EC973_000679 [Apophysomyces ossiformis]